MTLQGTVNAGKDSEDGLVYFVPEVVRLTRLSRNAVYAAIARGDLVSVRVGRRVLIPKKALHDFLEGRSRGG